MAGLLPRMVGWITMRIGAQPAKEPDYYVRMRAALDHIRMAELQLAQATSLEEFDLGRSALQQAHAEVQHIVRQAKRDLGLPLRPIQECEEMHRQMVESMYRRRSHSQEVHHAS